MNEREIDRAKKIVEIDNDIYESNQAIIPTGILSIIATVATAIILPITLCVSIPFVFLYSLVIYKIKRSQSNELKALGLTSKDLTRLHKSGEINNLYDLANNSEIEKAESFNYLPANDNSISRTTIYKNKPKSHDNDKSNEI